MVKHRHDFVNRCDEIVFGLDRETDEKSLIAYFQKFSDDELMALLVKRLSDDEITEMVDFLLGILKRHLKEEEYHRLFLKEE
ncbi:MAG: cytoplasmic protein [Desulfobacterales bacterium]|nr:cytoplasmic protein [Desulfobacterales bacterium]